VEIVYGNRTHRYTRKRAIEHRVRQCERRLRTLREELLAAEADVEEVDHDMDILRKFFEQQTLGEGSNSQLVQAPDPHYSDSNASDSEESGVPSSGHE
jgi:hypothetical protein